MFQDFLNTTIIDTDYDEDEAQLVVAIYGSMAATVMKVLDFINWRIQE